MSQNDLKLGIYEKALPAQSSWERKVEAAERLGFDFIEMSIDESDERLSRLCWDKGERRAFRDVVFKSSLTVPSLCFSGHRRYPLGSRDSGVRTKAREMMNQAIDLAVDTGIRTIQLAGYDVYYESGDTETVQWFEEGIARAVERASRENVMLAMEIMDTPFMSSIVRYLNLKKKMNTPWLTVYPDVGNLSAWGCDVKEELKLAIGEIAAVHLKETLKVTETFGGQFKEVPFGTGCVDFPAVFTTLAEANYKGPFVIEMWTEKLDDSRETERAVAEARNWILVKMREGGLLQ